MTKQSITFHYFFVWGNYPPLAFAEVLSALTRWNIRYSIVDVSVEAGVIATSQYLPGDFIEQLGGIVKFGSVMAVVKRDELTAERLAPLIAEDRKGRVVFGLSQYRLHNLSPRYSMRERAQIGKSLKKIIRRVHPVRWVVSRDTNLSAVVVKKNKLIERGVELVLLTRKRQVWVGRTIAVQPFEEYSERDYGRFSVDPKVGMLPPKLAQIMLNFSMCNTRDIILDPFCGSGTVLQEALMMGWGHVVGSDILKQAVDNTKKNISWLRGRYHLERSIVRLFHSDSRTLSRHFKGTYIRAIVTEPYLGPALKKKIDKKKAERLIDELEALYLLTFIDFKKYLHQRGRVVMVWPLFIVSGVRSGMLTINLFSKLSSHGFHAREPFMRDVSRFKLGTISPRGTFMYGRPQQKVWREIVVFDYKP